MIDTEILNRYRHFAENTKNKDGLHLLKYCEIVDGWQVTLLEQNRDTGSEWANLKQDGKEVVQVILEGDWYGVFVNGKLIIY